MKLIIPIEFYVKGGVERVIMSLTEEFSQRLDQVILVLPPKEVAYFQQILPPAQALVYETFSWEPTAWQSKALGAIARLQGVAKRLHWKGLEQWLTEQSRRFKSQYRVAHLAQRYGATHCLYFLTNRIVPPTLSIPLAMLSHDVFWRFAPLTYPADYIQEYDRQLLHWAQQSDIVFTNSAKTRADILSIFPQFAAKSTAIPLASSIPSSRLEPGAPQQNPTPVFYFPSTFGIYKDHLTLLQAAVILAERNVEFKVVLVGKGTDELLRGEFNLAKQTKTKEYTDYLQACQQLHQTHQATLARHVEGLGYCEYDTVEQWYRDCACVVVPSQYEGFGLAVAEAIARGVPAIVSDLDVFREQVELYHCDDRVEFFRRGDAVALADCMERFIQAPKPKISAQEIGDRFSHWTWHDVASQYIDTLAAASKSKP